MYACVYTYDKIKQNKANAMMRGKSQPSEDLLEKIKSNNSLGFKEDVEREKISFLTKIIILSYLFTYILINRTKTQQNRFWPKYFDCIFNSTFIIRI